MPTGELRGVILPLIKLILGASLFAIIIRTFLAQTKQRKRALAAFAETSRTAGGGGVFLVRYASAENFDAGSKVIAGDGFGLLTVEPSAVTFRGEVAGGARLELLFPPGGASASWVGRRWINGFFSWFVIDLRGGKHYFTSATSFGVIRSKSRTKRVYDAVAASLT